MAITSLSRILFLGSPGPKPSTTVYWDSAQDCNPADFEGAIIDCVSLYHWAESLIDEEGGNSRVINLLNRLREHLSKLVSTGGTVVAILGQEHRAAGADVLNCLPVNCSTMPDKGSTVENVDQRWKRYFSHVSSWDYYFRSQGIKVLESYIPAQSTSINPIAINRANQYLGLQFHCTSPSEIGDLFIVPAPNNLDIGSAIETILVDVFGVAVTPEPPEWANNVFIPGLEEIDVRLQDCQRKIENKQLEIESLLVEQSGKAKWRGLLYDTGYSLENLCEDAFKELGATTKPSDVSDEFIIIIDEQEILVEVKGVGKSAAKSHVGQILADSGKRPDENGFAGNLLIVNAWRNEPLGSRGAAGKPWFPSDVVKTAQASGVALLGTDTLLDLLRSHWETSDGLDAVRKLLSTSGVYQK